MIKEMKKILNEKKMKKHSKLMSKGKKMKIKNNIEKLIIEQIEKDIRTLA